MGKEKIPLPMVQVQGMDPCLDLCSGVCCQNKWLKNMSSSDFLRFSSKGPVFRVEDTNEKHDAMDKLSQRYAEIGISTDEGIHYVDNSDGTKEVIIAGVCPQREPNGLCGIHAQRPENCRVVPVGGQTCNNSRKNNGLAEFTSSVETKKRGSLKLGSTFFVGKILRVFSQ